MKLPDLIPPDIQNHITWRKLTDLISQMGDLQSYLRYQSKGELKAAQLSSMIRNVEDWKKELE